MAASSGSVPKAEILRNEASWFDGLFDSRPAEETVPIPREVPPGSGHFCTVLSVRIRPLSGDEIAQASDRATSYKQHPSMPFVQVPLRTNPDTLAVWKIVFATLPPKSEELRGDEDLPQGKNLWFDKAGWRKAKEAYGTSVNGPEEMVRAVLLPGERQYLAEKIDALSGYGLQARAELAENLSPPAESTAS